MGHMWSTGTITELNYINLRAVPYTTAEKCMSCRSCGDENKEHSKVRGVILVHACRLIPVADRSAVKLDPGPLHESIACRKSRTTWWASPTSTIEGPRSSPQQSSFPSATSSTISLHVNHSYVFKMASKSSYQMGNLGSKGTRSCRCYNLLLPLLKSIL